MRKAVVFVALLLLVSAFKMAEEVDADPIPCIQEKCPTQYANCVKDPKCVPALQDCNKKCGSSQSCWEFCLPGKGSQAAIDTAKCAHAQGCDKVSGEEETWQISTSTALAIFTPEDCIKQYCSSEAQSCGQSETCRNVLRDCEHQCKDNQTCWTTCVSGKGNPEASAFWKCIVDHDCLNKVETALAPVSVADPETCMKEKCPNQYAACQKDSKCPGVLQKCQNKCGTKESCWQLCLAQENDKPAIDLAKCAAANDCQKAVEEEEALSDPIPCIQEKCPTQYANCVKDPKCIPALQDCNKKCGSSQSCWEFCLPGKGSQAAIDTAKCAHAQGCDKVTDLATPQDCIEKFCKNEEQACENDRKCIITLNFCDSRCNTTLSCWKECLDKAKDINATKYFNCVVDHDCMDKVESKVITHKRKHHEKHGHKRTDLVTINDPETCMKEKCPNQYAACQKDSKCPGVLQKCQNKCGTKESCWQLCLAQENDKPAIDLAKCAAANDCQKAVEEEEEVVALSDPIPCIQEKCPTQYANCVKDPKCVPALQDCNKKCGSSQSCWEFCLPGKGSQAAIDTAKCAHAQGCDKVTLQSHPFMQCMNKSCVTSQLECLYDKHCSKYLHKCSKSLFNYDLECLSEKSKDSSILGGWFQCAGEHFCL